MRAQTRSLITKKKKKMSLQNEEKNWAESVLDSIYSTYSSSLCLPKLEIIELEKKKKPFMTTDLLLRQP